MRGQEVRQVFRVMACGVALTAAHAQASEFKASNGAILPAPEVERLTCADRSILLMEYTVSGYRGTEPLQRGHPDWPIYEYENRLAEVYYTQCQAGASQFQSLKPAFSSGFR